ncbi:MAG TPA: dihydrolipoamide acetyltransferase family protein [Candidatus Limnocylindrales bacterium]|nr:dihydrolipoamide acetyltransferase family protein [Candidatus Limnocylindrales bacterium]
MPKVTMPQLGESVAEGTIGKWLKKVGDHVDKYEPIVEVITDKVNAEVPSPFEGTLTAILVQEGETVPNNAEIAVIDGAGEAGAEAATAPAPTTATTAAPAAAGNGRAEPTVLGTGHGPAGSDERPVEEMRPAASAASAPAATTAPPAAQAPAQRYDGPVTPAVRRLAREHGIDLALVAGTGHGGRVTREDVLAYVEQQRSGAAPAAAATPAAATATPAAPPAAPAAPAPAAPQAQTVAPAAAEPPAPPRPTEDQLKPTTPMRKAIAAHMVLAKQTAPHAYTTVEVDMSGVVALRESVKGRYQAQEGVALSFVAIVAKAVVEALKRHPDLNAHWTEQGLLRKAAINLGIAVAVEDGLIVPVIKNADQYSIHGLNLFLQDYAARARAGKLKLDEVQGGSFTLNNTGWFGSVASQPIVNVPEVAILSMEAIVKRPVVIETANGDTIGIRPMMNVCVSFDHRGTDGAQVGRFVQDVRRWLENVDAQTPVW